jgi:hypothetical protein
VSLKSIDILYYTFTILVLYIPFHFLEEALGRFHETMYLHKWIPERITYGHWMANNVFFYFPVLQLAFIIFFFKRNLLFIGLGILCWGIFNFLDHIVYSVIDKKYSPGLYTSLLFALVSIAGIVSVSSLMNVQTILLSIVFGLIYVFLPVVLSMAFHKRFKKHFV